MKQGSCENKRKKKEPVIPVGETEDKRQHQSAQAVRDHIDAEHIRAGYVLPEAAVKSIKAKISCLQAVEEGKDQDQRQQRIGRMAQTPKDAPQPQVRLTFGLRRLNPACIRSSL